MIAATAATLARGITPGQAVAMLESDLGLTTKNLQIILDTSARKIARWVHEEAYAQKDARRRLAELMAFHKHLGTMFPSWEGARDWLRCPNRYLSGLTPLEALRAGRIDRARAALVALDAGVYV